MIEIFGTIEDVIFRNDDSGYTVAILEREDEEGYPTIVGNLSNCSVGTKYRLQGEFVTHKKYGEQFSFSFFEELMPTDTDEILDFLRSGAISGVGDKMAEELVKAFGENTLKVIDEHPEKLKKIKGIGPAKAAIISESFRTKREFADISLELQHYGINTELAFRLYRYCQGKVVTMLKDNPYQLVGHVRGFKFKKADELGQNFGIEKENENRLSYGILNYLDQVIYQGGHTFVPKKQLIQEAGAMLDVSSENIEEQLIHLVAEEKIRLDCLNEQEVVYKTSYYDSEQRVAYRLMILDKADIKSLKVDIDGLIKESEVESGIELSEEQKMAVRNTVTSGVSVITGGPGTGKTTIINTIIKVFKGSGFKISIAAPTGRAAKRITETSGHPASTVHRLLEYYYSEEDDMMVFGKTEEDPLDSDVVIIDEASMMDLLLMESLLDAIKLGSRLVIVGDRDQLPSVGAGNVLGDIIDSEYIYTSELKTIFRQAAESMIVTNAHKINHGERPILNQGDKDFFLIRTPYEVEMRETIVDLITTRLPRFIEGLSPLDDIQVITPTKIGKVGTVALNEMLQQALNPPGEDKAEKKWAGRIFRVGDKVMQMSNNYQQEWTCLSDLSDGTGVFNGDVGRVQSINFQDKTMEILFDEDKLATYEFENLDSLELAYAVTVHKSQGNEFPVVIMPISRFNRNLATRNLLYTAVTRGKKLVVLVGSENRLQFMIQNNEILKRNSGLKERIQSFFGILD